MFRRSHKAWRRRVKQMLQAASLFLLCVLLVTPLRNLVFSPVLPAAWRTHSSLRLASMLLDTQRFPVDELEKKEGKMRGSDSGGGGVSLEVDLNDLQKFMEKEDPFEEFHRQRDLLAKKARHNTEAAEELQMVKLFKPVMTAKERALLLFTLDVFIRACRQHGLTFFLLEGSLLGSYRHHGLVPWDDDVDIAVNGSQWREVRRVLSSIPGFTLFAPSDVQWKFYLSSLPAFPDKPYKWPNVDLFFVTQRDQYVWALTWGIKNHLILHSRHLLPFSTVRWERWQLPAPACVERMLTLSYNDPGACVTPTYVHKTNEVRYGFQTDVVECRRLHKYFPFVFRSPAGSNNSKDTRGGAGPGWTVESRRIGDRVLQDITVPPLPSVCLD